MCFDLILSCVHSEVARLCAGQWLPLLTDYDLLGAFSAQAVGSVKKTGTMFKKYAVLEIK